MSPRMPKLALLALLMVLSAITSAGRVVEAQAPPEFPSVSVDRGSGTGYDPADILLGAPPNATSVIPCANLGLLACGGGDNLDALSYGAELVIFLPSPVIFSVSPASNGLAGTPVQTEATCSPPEAQADEFGSSGAGDQNQVKDGDGVQCGLTAPLDGGLGLCEVPPCPASAADTDDLDALEHFPPGSVDLDGNGVPDLPVYLSLDAISPTLSAIGAGPADVLRFEPAAGLAVWAPATTLGLSSGDDVDALCIADDGDGVFTLGVDVLLFSLRPGSPTLAANGWSAADVLAATLSGPAVALSTDELALLAGDDLDALKCNILFLILAGQIPPGGGGPQRGEPRDISVSPSPVVFPPSDVGSVIDIEVVVANAGTSDPLALGAIAPPGPPFGIVTDGCSSQTLDPGSSCSLLVRFAPAAGGSFSGTIGIPSDDPDENPFLLALSGEGVALIPNISVSPVPIDFGPAKVGSFSDRTLMVNSAGNGALFIAAVRVTGAPFGIVLDGCTSRTMTPGTSCEIGLRFTPGPPGGVVSGGVAIESNDPDQGVFVVDLTALGVVPPTLLSPDDSAVFHAPLVFRLTANPAGVSSLTYIIEIRNSAGDLVGSLDQLLFPNFWSKSSYVPGETAELTWPLSLLPGEYRWRARVRYGGSLAVSDLSESRLFLLLAPAPVIGLFPSGDLLNGGSRLLIILGENFAEGATVTLTRGGRGEPDPGDVQGVITFFSPSGIFADVDITAFDFLGEWDVVVRNPDGQEARRPILIQPSILYPALQPTGVLGIPVVPEGSERANYLEITNVGNDDGFFWMQISPPAPGVVNLKINSRISPIWDSTKEVDPSRVDLLVPVLKSFTSYLPMYWGVPAERVVFPQSGTTASLASVIAQQSGQVTFGSELPTIAKATLGQAKDQVKDILKETLTNTDLCAALADINPDLLGAVVQSLKDAVAEKVDELTSLGVPTTFDELLEDVGEEFVDKIKDVLGIGTATEIAQKLIECQFKFFDAFDKKFRMEAKAAADRLRAASGGDTNAALTKAVEDISMRCGGRLYCLLAITRTGGLLDELHKPPCSPPPAFVSTWLSVVRGPWDPNDKTFNGAYDQGQVMEAGGPRGVAFIPMEQATEPITYVISFENKAQATAPAESVVITDDLDADFDIGSFELIATNHPDTLSTQISGSTVTFRFPDINLPPNVNPPDGEGYVTFSVRPKAGLATGTQFRNKASIVFDFNPPIQTSEVVHILGEPLAVPIDVLPGEDPNPINPRRQGVVPVAVLTTPEFDAVTMIDPSTVLFEGAPVVKALTDDVDRDRDEDLVLFFDAQSISIRPGQTMGCLTGLGFAGLALRGCDSTKVIAG